MNLLANLMPGLRSLRAPLAAGFLLLLSIWLAFEEKVPASPSEGIWASLERLEPLTAAFGTVGLVTFAAYLLGSLYIVAVAIRPRRLADIGVGPRPMWLSASVETTDREKDAEQDWVASGNAFDVGPIMAFSSRRRLREYLEENAIRLEDPDHRDEDVRWFQKSSHPAASLPKFLAGQTVLRLYRDWDTLPLTIVGTEPQLYGEIDRFRAEAEFRSALLGPLVLLCLVVAIRLAGWASLIPVAVAVVIGPLIWYAKRDAESRANSVLANAIAAGLVKLPGDRETVRDATNEAPVAGASGT